ncbi:MAG: S-layer homology domain-containing protein [Candidatus Riflebacteria bacterium]|nr:S-layer homology domain-containing protein [Candidatus Riflebacteria bacterium]
MSQHKLAFALVGILVAPGLAWAGYPDVPRSHWAHDAVSKAAQSGIIAAKKDGLFHGEKAASRYDLAVGLAKVMAETENRLMSEGRNTEDIVPYIERINLYVADEIDGLKQAQKEIRARLNEVLERLDRRECGAGAPCPPPNPPMMHPHKSPVPMTEIHNSPPVRAEQKIHRTAVHRPSLGDASHVGAATVAPRARPAAVAVARPEQPAQVAQVAQAVPAPKSSPVRFPSDEEAWQGVTQVASCEPGEISVARKAGSLEEAFNGLKQALAPGKKPSLAKKATHHEAGPGNAEEVAAAPGEPSEADLAGTFKTAAHPPAAAPAAAATSIVGAAPVAAPATDSPGKAGLSASAMEILKQMRERAGR